MFGSHFEFEPHSLVNFTGGGGKTALIFRLLEEFSAQGSVLYTTTTRIHPPDPGNNVAVIKSANLQLLKFLVTEAIRNCSEKKYKLVATRQFMEPDLLKGVPPDFLDSVDRGKLAILLNEADGAARFSLKLPRDGEPVLMDRADYLVAVIGIDCLHQPLGPDVVFRFQTLAQRFSLKAGDRITPRLAAGILMHPRGVCKDFRKGTTLIPFINKVDTPGQDADARALASHILQNVNFPVKKVVWGSVVHGRVGSVSAES
ncbi:MAG: putative selenium-dependent hydroxylase accessory protein YqeC [Acidobacteria bacterium]|nr:putative selenium-dependent hydroxylase accessory protein YqeC [Acidobacteriota bacterium]